MSEFLSVGDCARRLKVSPREITNLFYLGKLRDDLCPLIGGRRLIRPEYVSQIEWALRRAGKLPAIETRGRHNAK